jgi:hypothetical protein
MTKVAWFGEWLRKVRLKTESRHVTARSVQSHNRNTNLLDIPENSRTKHVAVLRKRESRNRVSGKALAAGSSLKNNAWEPVASAIPLKVSAIDRRPAVSSSDTFRVGHTVHDPNRASRPRAILLQTQLDLLLCQRGELGS